MMKNLSTWNWVEWAVLLPNLVKSKIAKDSQLETKKRGRQPLQKKISVSDLDKTRLQTTRMWMSPLEVRIV